MTKDRTRPSDEEPDWRDDIVLAEEDAWDWQEEDAQSQTYSDEEPDIGKARGSDPDTDQDDDFA